jgi:ATP-binding cassette subfamily C protein
MRVFLYFAREYPWQSLLVLVCLILAGLLDGLGLTAILPVLGVAFQGGEDAGPPEGFEARVLEALDALGVPRELEPLLLLMAGLFLAKAALLVVAKRQVGYTVAHVATDLRLRLLRALMGSSWSYYTRLPVGAATNAMGTEAGRAALAYRRLGEMMQLGLQGLVAGVVALSVSWRATLAAAAAGALSLVLLRVFVRMAARGGRRQTVVLRSLSSRLTDILQATKLLRATAKEPLVGPLLEEDTRRLNKALRKKVLGKEVLHVLQEPIMVGFCLLFLWAGLRWAGMPTEQVVLLILLFARTLGNVGQTQQKYQGLVTQQSALWSIVGMIGDAESQREPEGGTAEPHLERGLALRGVSVEYDGSPVLRDVDVEMPVGSITALVGPSGAGKTTFVDLLTGLVQPSKGDVEVDGTPLSELDLRRWRGMIGYVLQELFLLNDTVRMNVTLGDPEITDAQVEQALRDAGAWEYVSQLEGGIDAPVGERGSLLSGGQRQRVAIARALLHQPKLLVLDEATAALDPENEAAVWATVAKLRGRTTVVAISHQPGVMGVADRVYQIADGVVQRLEAPLRARSGG